MIERKIEVTSEQYSRLADGVQTFWCGTAMDSAWVPRPMDVIRFTEKLRLLPSEVEGQVLPFLVGHVESGFEATLTGRWYTWTASLLGLPA